MRSVYTLTDTFWVGKLGSAPLAALCQNAFAFWIVQLCCQVCATGVHARVSAAVGAGDDDAVSETIVQGLWGALITYG